LSPSSSLFFLDFLGFPFSLSLIQPPGFGQTKKDPSVHFIGLSCKGLWSL
ncbi:unnamed protein product, partial [Prunus brigantina]